MDDSAILDVVSGIDPGQAIDIASRVLAVIVSLVGLVVAISQWTRPAILKRRVTWLQETMKHEQNKVRLGTLALMLQRDNASLVAGVLVPSWRFLPLTALMLLGPAQAFFWARNDVNGWNILGALGISLGISMNPIRRGVRLLAERYRVAYEYHEGISPVRTARLGILNQMEGGTRLERVFGFVAALGINSVAVGIALVYLDQLEWGLILGVAGVVLTLVIVWRINTYAKKRVGIYGPWSVEDPSL